MMVVKGQELLVTADNKVGALADVAAFIAGAGANIRAVSAWAVGQKAYFRFITSDNAAVKETFTKNGIVFDESDAVIAELPDETGQLKNITSQLKDSGIDLAYIYGTAASPGSNAIVVFSSSDNEKALTILSR